jgi:hypothetical protein
MENNKSKPNEKQECGERSSEEIMKPLLSQREIRSIVKDFAIAYLEGRIKIGFVNAEEKMAIAGIRGQKIDRATALDKEIQEKVLFRNRVAVCLGSKKATSDELQQAISELFDTILSYRNGQRIEGVFSEYSLTARVKEIEEGLDKVNNLVEEIVEWITGLPPEREESNNESMP